MSVILATILFSACAAPISTEQSTQQPKPATFTVSDLSISPTEVGIGESIDSSVRVTNNGDIDDNYIITFKINGVASDSHEVNLAGHQSVTTTFTTTVTGEDAAGTYTIDVNGLSGSFIIREVSPSAEFTVTSFDQTYSDLLKQWSSVYIDYKIHNTGETHISYYEVYFTITCDDGSQYQDWTNGSDIFIGQELPDSAIALVDGKKVTSVEIDNFELTAGAIPDEATSAEFTINSFNQKEEADYVYISYTIQNSGEEHISSYRAYVTVTCDDGSQYQGQISERDILVGQKWTNTSSIRVSGKKVTSVVLTDWGALALAGTPPAVIYEITGTATKVDVTLANASGGTEQYSNVSLPKKYTYNSFSDSFLYVSAQNQGESGSVTVSIYVNGKLFKTSRSSGAYVIADASGSK
jgi:hypothetical protein